jgi:fatty-acyl-CoA synthase
MTNAADPRRATPPHALSCASGPDQPAIRDITLGELLAWAAATTPERVALIAGTADPASRRQWTYAELHTQAQRTARALRERFEPGERVAIWAANIPEWVLVEFGAAMAGLVLVTVNPALKASEVEFVLKQSRAAGVLVMDSFRGNPMRATATAVAARCPELREIIGLTEWAAFLASGGASEAALPAVQSTDAVMIQYTSGTTGFPKGALLHHRGLVNNAIQVTARMGVTDGDVLLGVMPMFHTGGCAVNLLGTVANRGTLVLVEAFEPGLVLELLARYRANALLAVPTMLIALLEHPAFAGTDLSHLRAICSGGSTVPAALVTTVEERMGAAFTIIFGQTECSPVALMTRPTDSLADKAHTLGTPLPHVAVKIVDPASGQTAAVGTVGEICTRGYHVMHGYFEMPEASAAAIDADGWLHTGDLGAMDARGYFTVEGRLKDMIIRGGENIYPRELEELLFKHPAIAEVAVIGLPHDKWGEEVAAIVRPQPGQPLNPGELAAYMREHLAPHKTPRHWFVVDAFPLTSSGKIQKFKLREQCEAGELTAL